MRQRHLVMLEVDPPHDPPPTAHPDVNREYLVATGEQKCEVKSTKYWNSQSAAKKEILFFFVLHNSCFILILCQFLPEP